MIKKLIFLFLLVIAFVVSYSQQFGEFKDSRDGKVYKTVKIGTQIWMAENLNADKFQNGETIPVAKSRVEWDKAVNQREPAFCYYNNDLNNKKIYGNLYNGHAVNSLSGLAPKGWHIPSNKEWKVLRDYLKKVAKTDEYRFSYIMKSNYGWVKHEYIVTGTNISGFSALPGGYRSGWGTRVREPKKGLLFESLGEEGLWWSADRAVEPWTKSVWSLDFNSNDFGEGGNAIIEFAFSVRCIKD